MARRRGPRGRGRFASLPNLLTYFRILAIPALVACFFVVGDWGRWTAMWIFIAAGVSDFLDGYLARAWEQQSAIGRMLDPIADKLIVAAALLMLAADGTIAGWSLWAGVIILCREILVSGLREFLGYARRSACRSRRSPNGRPWCRWLPSAFCSPAAPATRSGPTRHCSA